MELVPGQTLAERLSTGPLPVEKALRICAQIAEAIGGAHQKRIIHRDIKPPNIKITPERRVKVLDFGLAKLAPEAQTDGTTLTEMTHAGVFLGTPTYMSPEQLRSETVDHRTHIWAFGCILYQLLRGCPPFRGSSIAEMIVSVLTAEPDWEALPAGTPPKVLDLVRRCLQKAAVNVCNTLNRRG
jgi:serine/threonine protein kinase